jgi:hypothetical protein
MPSCYNLQVERGSAVQQSIVLIGKSRIVILGEKARGLIFSSLSDLQDQSNAVFFYFF